MFFKFNKIDLLEPGIRVIVGKLCGTTPIFVNRYPHWIEISCGEECVIFPEQFLLSVIDEEKYDELNKKIEEAIKKLSETYNEHRKRIHALAVAAKNTQEIQRQKIRNMA